MSTALFDDVPAHFPMGHRGGRITPTNERISDTDSTPFGLSLRVVPATAREVGAEADERADGDHDRR